MRPAWKALNNVLPALPHAEARLRLYTLRPGILRVFTLSCKDEVPGAAHQEDNSDG
jgi:hypothetical protein